MGKAGTGRTLAVLGTALAALLALGSCSAPTGPEPEPEPSYSPSYVAGPDSGLAPLTGVAVEPGSLDHPSLAAKIDNHLIAQPQTGLERTDIVFEELVEGGITRYVAVWHSDIPEEIGPIRSIRPMDPEIVAPFGGIIAYSGGQYRFVVLMEATDVYNAIHGSRDTADIMYRSPNRPSPHDVIVRAEQLVRAQGSLAPPAQQFAFADAPEASTAAVDGEAVDGATVHFTAAAAPSWEWDAERRVWLRSQLNGVDRDSNGDQLTAVNVIVLPVPVTYGLGLPKTELIGNGQGWVMSEGKVARVRWSKSSRDASIRLVDEHGAVVRLAPGNSWIELMPTSGTFAPHAASTG